MKFKNTRVRKQSTLNNQTIVSLLGIMKAKMPIYRSTYTVRKDGMGRNIPNICFKVPTGGGKTLPATAAVQRINQAIHFNRRMALSCGLYAARRFTRKPVNTFVTRTPLPANVGQGERWQNTDSGKNDKFTAQDVQDNLCIMLLMLQSRAAVKRKKPSECSKIAASLKSFFPLLYDYTANNALLSAVPNLQTADLGEYGQ